MEKKVMYITVAVIAILLVAGIGAALLLSNNSSKATQSIKIVTIKEKANSTAFSPLDQDAVLSYANSSSSGGYALSRYLYLYTDGNATGAEWTWLNWILTSGKGQKNATDAGFYALPTDIQKVIQAKLIGGTGSSTGSIVQSGSTTMLEMANLWHSAFNKEYPGITISINYPGSGPGIQNLMDGKCDIAQASRAMKQSEKDNMTAHGGWPVEYKVAVDGMAIVVNSDNNITTLTLDQLKQIYNGNYSNWNQLGGQDKTITLYGRDAASGTGDYFIQTVLGGVAPSASMQQFTSTAPIIQQVKDNKGAVGYVGIGYAKEGTASQTLMEGGNSVTSLVQLSEMKLSLV